MKKAIVAILVLIAVLGFSCVSGNLTGIWESEPDESGKFRRYHFTETGEFSVEACKLKKGEEKPAREDEVWKILLLWILKRGEETSDESANAKEKFKCVEAMSGEYKVTRYCDTTVNCILKPNHKVSLKPKTGVAGLLSKLTGPKEMEFTRKGLKLTLGDEKLTRVPSKKFNLRDLF